MDDSAISGGGEQKPIEAEGMLTGLSFGSIEPTRTAIAELVAEAGMAAGTYRMPVSLNITIDFRGDDARGEIDPA